MLFSIATGIRRGCIGGDGVNLGKVDAAGQIAVTLTLLVGYVITALGFSTIYRATALLSLWRLGMKSLRLSGLSALEKVKVPAGQVGRRGSPTVNVGGYDAGRNPKISSVNSAPVSTSMA